MTRPTVSLAQQWRPDALAALADSWEAAARSLSESVTAAVADAGRGHWTGAAAEAARERARRITADTEAVARRLVAAAAVARDGATQMSAARDDVLSLVERARHHGFHVADDGSASVAPDLPPVAVLLAGGDETVTGDMLSLRAAEVSARIGDALDRLGSADDDAAGDIAAALNGGGGAGGGGPAATVPAGLPTSSLGEVVSGWPVLAQDRIAAQIAAMTPEQRRLLVTEFPQQTGNTDGVPWELRAAANRLNIASAILRESGADERSRERIAFYRGLLGEIDAAEGGPRIPRTIVAFDPDRASLIELNGDLATARGVAVLVPGVNTTIEGSAANTATARRFVAQTRGEVAVITYLGGPFPQVGDPVEVVRNAADPRYATEMAPRLVAFTEDLDRRVGDGVPVTVIGHSYGGSIVGTAETQGLTSDRTLFLAAAGAGVGVDDPGDWHNRNPHVERFSMTPPGDFITLVQGIPGGPHGADPDELVGVTPLGTGYYDDGGRVSGWEAHSGMLNRPGDSWRTILAVITGDSPTVHRAAANAPQ